jgi:hypothetical protein
MRVTVVRTCDQMVMPVGKPVVAISTKPSAILLAGGNW